MKKLVLSLFLFMAILTPYNKAQAMDPKAKAFMIMCTYGTVGGALLGFASMAFGTNSRAIAQGASLGLYAGIAFGAFVITSHGQKSDPYLEQQEPPPGFDQPPGGFGQQPFDNGYGAPQDDNGGGFFGGNRVEQIHTEMLEYRMKNKKSRDFSLPIYMNLVNYQF